VSAEQASSNDTVIYHSGGFVAETYDTKASASFCQAWFNIADVICRWFPKRTAPALFLPQLPTISSNWRSKIRSCRFLFHRAFWRSKMLRLFYQVTESFISYRSISCRNAQVRLPFAGSFIENNIDQSHTNRRWNVFISRIENNFETFEVIFRKMKW